MATSTRLRGNEGLLFKLKIGAGTSTNYGDDIKVWAIEADDADDSNLTFYDAQQGLVKEYTVTVTAVVSNATGSLYEYLWANPGATFSELLIAPHGNTTATTTQPHYTMVATATGKPVFEHEAGVDNQAEFEYEFKVQGDLSKVTA